MDPIVGLALLVGIYALGRATSSAHGKLKEEAKKRKDAENEREAARKELQEQKLLVVSLNGERAQLTDTVEQYSNRVVSLQGELEEHDRLLRVAHAQLESAQAEAATAKALSETAIDELTEQLDAQHRTTEEAKLRAEDAEAALEAAMGRAARLSEDARRTADAFVAWCNRAAPLVGRYYMFERALKRSVPEAAVSPVYRHRTQNDNGTVQFKLAAEGAEYWFVRAGGERLLLPRPRTPDAFCELAPAFEGQAIPRAVVRIAPARLTSDGDSLVLDTLGDVA